jgi:parallel beta-helix repeat protein
MDKPTPLFLTLVLLVSALTLISGFHITLADPKTIVVSTADSIQEGINNATAGDTIIVLRGTYMENVVVNKAVFLIGADRDGTIVDANRTGNAFFVIANNVTITNFTVRNSGDSLSNAGIYVSGSGGNISYNKLIGNNNDGIGLHAASAILVTNNVVSSNTNDGISLYSSTNCTVKSNVVTGNVANGIAVYTSSGNVITQNTLASNLGGIYVYSNDNLAYHNNFISNVINAQADSSSYWDYAGEGNFWSDYTSYDLNQDGIGDVPRNFTTTVTNVDNFPLMGQFHSFAMEFGSDVYEVSIISNSTVTDIHFEVSPETGNRLLRFNASGSPSAMQFSRVAVPVELMPEPYFVLLDGEQLFPKTLNGSSPSHNYLYFTYSSGSDIVTIVSSETLRLYNDLLAKYDKLQADLDMLNQSYYSLLNDHTMLLNNFGQLQLTLADLNTSVQSLESLTVTYNNLLANYIQLLGNFTQLQNSLQGFSSENLIQEQNLRNLMYILAAIATVFVAMTAYLSNRAHSGLKPTTKSSEETTRNWNGFHSKSDNCR